MATEELVKGNSGNRSRPIGELREKAEGNPGKKFKATVGTGTKQATVNMEHFCGDYFAGPFGRASLPTIYIRIYISVIE
jgi:hypothetical protein